jgi:magnesium-protoporphyrin O-methyltransferase
VVSGDPCGPGCACTVGNEFGADSAERDLRDYRRDGPDRTTRWLLDGLRGGEGGSVDGLTVLDIGAGVGVVHLELLAAGAASAVDVDGSPAYVAVAQREADRTGLRDRITYLTGDFVELGPSLAPADLVALDRVVCCYPDMRALVSLSASRTRRRYGLVYPRDSWWIRVASSAFNSANRLLRRRFRFHAHRTADVEAVVAAAGLRPVDVRRTIFWQVAVFERT